jgi:hypothetical protein
MSKILTGTVADGGQPVDGARTPRELLTMQFGNFSPKMRSVLEQAAVLAASGFFASAKTLSQAAAKIMIGAELGFPPMASIANIHVFRPEEGGENAVAIGAHLMAAAIDRSDDHDFEIVTKSDQLCKIKFFKKSKRTGEFEERGIAEFSLEDAATAQLAHRKTWKKYATDMLYARTMARGFRTFCASLIGGVNVYAPEELGFVPDGDGGYVRDPEATEPELRDADAPVIEMPRRASETGGPKTVEIMSKSGDLDDYTEGASITLRVGTELFNLKGEHAGYWHAAHGGESPLTCTGPGCERCEWRVETKTCAKNPEHAAFVGPWCPTCAQTPPAGAR